MDFDSQKRGTKNTHLCTVDITDTCMLTINILIHSFIPQAFDTAALYLSVVQSSGSACVLC